MTLKFTDLVKEEKISLHNMRLSDSDYDVLAEVLQKSSDLEYLHLISDRNALKNTNFVDAIAHSGTLKDLVLRDGNIGVEGARLLGTALKKNKYIQRLHLEVKIGDEGAKRLVDAMGTNYTLEEIHLSYNKIYYQWVHDAC